MLSYISDLPAPAYAEHWPRRLTILGSTGSIGRSALDVVAAHPEYFQIRALAGGKNVSLLAGQANKWQPPFLAVQDEDARLALLKLLKYKAEVLIGQEGYVSLASLPETDLALSAQVGAAGLRGTMAAIRAGKVVALANKESLVLAGDLVRRECRVSGAAILPIDSEHNAIFQCLTGQSTRLLPQRLEPAVRLNGECRERARPSSALKRIILTASGGPFRGKSRDFLEKATRNEALAHPTWSMGAKITIDSATLMNKGLEVIEACHLFGLPASRVDVVVHPQSIVHSLVEYQDNSQLAQLGAPDMRVPISGCLGWPYRLQSTARQLDLLNLPALTFEAPDTKLFPALNLCRQAHQEGRGLSIALNAANEIAVILFMAGKIKFGGITDLTARVLEGWSESVTPENLEQILELDAKARREAKQLSGQS